MPGGPSSTGQQSGNPGGQGGVGGGTTQGPSGSRGEPHCPPVPFHPAGANVDRNINAARALGLRGSTVNMVTSMFLFYDLSRNGGSWDYKQQGRVVRASGAPKPNRSLFEHFGNFNYGATGGAWGIPLGVLQRAAGVAQLLAGTSEPDSGSPLGSFPYSDDVADQIDIIWGYIYYENGCNDRN